MKIINKLAIATAAAVLTAPMAFAQISNPLTNIASFVGGCELATVGIDFGVQPAGPIANNIISVNANTSIGNMATGNGDHPDAAADDGESVGATTGIGPVDLIINTALDTVSFEVPGVYVVCTTPAQNIVIDGNGTDFTVDLTASSVLANDITFTSTLEPSSEPNGATSSLTYGLGFTGPVVVADAGVPGIPAITTALLVATGTINGTQTATAGTYTDVVAVTLNF